MREIPTARTENARLPLYKRPALRRLVTVAILVIACTAGWRLLKAWQRPASSKQLAHRQDKARAAIGDAFDDLFADQLETGWPYVQFVAHLDVSDDLGEGYRAATSCARGFDQAFEEALGADVVSFSVGDQHQSIELELTAAITPRGAGFQLANSSHVHSGVALTGDVRFMGRIVHVDVTPADEIEFEHIVHDRFDLMNRGPSSAEVEGGILQGACKQAALSVLESLTPWRRPPSPASAIR